MLGFVGKKKLYSLLLIFLKKLIEILGSRRSDASFSIDSDVECAFDECLSWVS